MASSHADHAHEMHLADKFWEAVDRAVAQARELLGALTERWSDSALAPRIEVGLDYPDPDDEPVLQIRVLLALDEDFSVDEWPGEALARLKSEIRKIVSDQVQPPINFVVIAQSAPVQRT